MTLRPSMMLRLTGIRIASLGHSRAFRGGTSSPSSLLSAFPTPNTTPSTSLNIRPVEVLQLRSFASLRKMPKKKALPYTMLIKDARSWKDSIAILNDIVRSGFNPDVYHYSAAISKCAKEGKWRKALGLKKTMVGQGVKPNVVVYNAVIDACANGGNSDMAIKLLREIEEQGLKPNVRSFNTAISACGKSARTDDALSLFVEMEERGIEPNKVSFCAAISACEKGGGGYTDTALAIFDEMKNRGIAPDEIAYSAAISACEKGGRTDTALELLSEMKECSVAPNLITYSAAISACEKGGGDYTDTAVALLEEMKGRGIKPDFIAYGAIVEACFDDRRYSEALEKTREAIDRGIYPNFVASKLAKWDLHDLSEATSCMLIADSLISIVDASRFRKVTIITGKGIHSDDAPVLQEKVPRFLREVAGIKVSMQEGNAGAFIITHKALQKWGTSGKYKEFKNVVTNQ